MQKLSCIDHPNRREEQPAARGRRPLPPQDSREWLTPAETALALGCGVATVHRLRRGLIAGVEPLPFTQYGRKVIFWKTSIDRWRQRIEKGRLAA